MACECQRINPENRKQQEMSKHKSQTLSSSVVLRKATNHRRLAEISDDHKNEKRNATKAQEELCYIIHI